MKIWKPQHQTQREEAAHDMQHGDKLPSGIEDIAARVKARMENRQVKSGPCTKCGTDDTETAYVVMEEFTLCSRCYRGAN